MEDEKIIQLYWDRDQAAIGETQTKYGPRLYQLSHGILSDRRDAEESVNDTYLAAWNAIPPKRPVYLFAFLAKICRYISFGRLDWNNAKKRSAQVVALTEELESCIPDPASEDEVSYQELGKLLDRFLASLPREKRMLFLRRYWFGDSIQTIASRCGMGESAVKVSLFRTRNKLKAFLRKEGIGL